MKVPSNQQWTQDNSGDVLGVLGSTTNMALDTLGKATLAHKAVALVDNDVDQDFGYPVAIVYFDDAYQVVTDDECFFGSLNGATWTQQPSFSPATTLGSDAVVYNSLMIVTLDDNFARWNGGGSIAYNLGALTAGVPHPMCVFGTLLAIGNGPGVNLYNTSWVNTVSLSLPTEYEVTSLRARNDYIYVGTRNKNGGEARIFIWDGDSTLYNYEVPVGASWVFSMTEYKNTVAAITSQGQLGLVNGTSFEHLAALPVFYDPHARWQGSGGLQLNGKVFNRGMVTIGDCIYLNVEGSVDVGFVPEMKSGIWVFDPSIGLYHRSASSTDAVVTDAALTRTGDILTTSAAHNLKTGDAVAFRTVSGLTGINDSTTYYVTVVSSTEIKLSPSRKSLRNGYYITLGGTPGANDRLVYTPNTDYGTIDATSGAIAATVYNETPLPIFSSEVVWGCRLDLPDGTAHYVLNTFADAWNVGSFTTQRVYTDNIDQVWREVYGFIDGLSVDTEEVVVKVQTRFETPTMELSGVWLDSTTINSVSDFAAWYDIEEGDELVIVDGYGRGRTVHVTEKNTSSGTHSLIVNEAIGSANQALTLYQTTFRHVGTYSVDNKLKEKIKASVAQEVSPWVAIKMELRGFALSVNMIDLSHIIHKGT